MNDGMAAPASFLKEVSRERDAAVEAAGGRASGAEALRELETQREGRAEIEGERDERATVLEAEISELQQVINRIEQEAQLRLAADFAAWGELIRLRRSLSMAERQLQARDAAAITTIEAGDISMLRDKLADVEQQAQQRATSHLSLEGEFAVVRAELKEARHEAEKRAAALHAIEDEAAALRDAVAATTVLRAEISVLRRKLTASEKQAQQDAASRSALEGELAAAQNALAAAQGVGRALHALVTSNSPPFDRLPRLGWRQAMRRWFGFAGNP
jgi:hypothetical protein